MVDRMAPHKRKSAPALRSAARERGSFLLAKQFMYFERYGKMYLADVAVLSDRPFFEALLREGPIADN